MRVIRTFTKGWRVATFCLRRRQDGLWVVTYERDDQAVTDMSCGDRGEAAAVAQRVIDNLAMNGFTEAEEEVTKVAKEADIRTRWASMSDELKSLSVAPR